jgi:hypothetical protein
MKELYYLPFLQYTYKVPWSKYLEFENGTSQNKLHFNFSVLQSWGSMPVFPTSPLASGEHGPCMDHNHEILHPVVMSTWMPDKVGGMPGKSLVFAETQVNS